MYINFNFLLYDAVPLPLITQLSPYPRYFLDFSLKDKSSVCLYVMFQKVVV